MKKSPKPNGCTLFPEGKHTPCCNQHDMDYALGIDRKIADKELKRCIHSSRSGIFWSVMTPMIYISVRMFGWYFYEKAKWNREGRPTGDKWWIWGRLKMLVMPK